MVFSESPLVRGEDGGQGQCRSTKDIGDQIQLGGSWEVLLNDGMGSRKLSRMVGGFSCHCQATEKRANGFHHVGSEKWMVDSAESQAKPRLSQERGNRLVMPTVPLLLGKWGPTLPSPH